MANSQLLHSVLVLGSCRCLIGCGDKETVQETAGPAQTGLASLSQTGGSSTNQSTAKPPPLNTGPVQTVPVEFNPTAPPEQQFSKVVEGANMGLFQAEKGVEAPKSALELMTRAVQAYEIRRDESDQGDGPTMPVLTELNQLVKYRILRALPAAPSGQKFVFDSKTKVVTLAPQ
jgi:hypothetical protein